MTTPTHDLAIARAERDAWQSTCEELHRTIAGRDVEIEAHLGRCEAADQRARSLDAALTAEREAGKGLVAQAEALRTESKHYTAIANHNAEIEAELAAIRDLVAPGNPQGTVVDAVRAMATGLIESIGARDAAEQARDMARDSRDAAIARAEAAERTLSGLYDDSKAELSKLRAKVADLTVTRDRLLAREHEDGRLHAQLRAELAELRARPVLTVDMAERVISTYCDEFAATDREGRTDVWAEVDQARRDHAIGVMKSTIAKLGPVTLPSPDRAEELCRAYHDRMSIDGKPPAPAWNEFSAEARVTRVTAMRLELTAIAKLSPDPAPTFDAAFLRRVLVATKHGPNGKGGPGPCDAACVKCEAELMAKAAPAREVAPTLVAVSDEELAVAFYSEPERPALRECIDAADLAGIRAVRAKLGAAEVTEERVKAALKLLDGTTSSDDLTDDESLDDRVTFFMTSLRASAAKGG